MKAKQQANQYDKIIKENLEAITMALMEKVLYIFPAMMEELPDDIQTTLERKPDQLIKITDEAGCSFILHLEFQLADDSLMPYRMLEYLGLLARKYQILIRQYVIFLGDFQPAMSALLPMDGFVYQYHLISITNINYEVFLKADKPEEIVFSILGNFGTDTPEDIVEKIVSTLYSMVGHSPKFEKYIKQLRVLANLRKLRPVTEKLMESITKYFKEEDDLLYVKGKRDAERTLIINLLKTGSYTLAQIATLTDTDIEFVKKVKADTGM